MRLLPKSPPSSPRRAKIIRQVSPKKQRISSSKGSIVATSSKQVDHRATPYELHPVPTAHGYESDDSDAELEQAPSRYDLSVLLPDDVAFDDASNDRYSQVGRRLAMMSNDSDSAQWRSFDEYDRRDPANAGEDPLQFDREGEDWEDLDDMVDHEGHSISDFRDDARNMKSVTDNAGESIDDDEDGSSISSTVTGTVEAQIMPAENQVKPAEKPNHVAAALQKNQQSSNPAPMKSRTGSDDRVSDQTKPSAQVQADIIQRVTDELNAKKRQDKDKKVIQTTKKGFGLFRRKSQKASGAPATIESTVQQEQRQRAQALESPSVPLARNRDNEESPIKTQSQPPRGILKAPSFVSRPDDDEQNRANANASENSGIYGFFSSLLGQSDVENGLERPRGPTVGGSKQEQIEEEESDFLASLCGVQQAPEEQSDQDRGMSASKSGDVPDIVYDSRSPRSNGDKEKEGMPIRLMETDKLDRQKQNVAENGQDFELCAPDNNCLRSASALRDTEGHDKTTDSDKVFTNRSMVLGGIGQEQDQEFPDDAKDQVLVQCLRDSKCTLLANCIVDSTNRIDNMGCAQTYEFMDDFMNAENPQQDENDGNPVIGARALSLDNERSDERNKGRRKKHDDIFVDTPHDLPIKVIEFPMQRFDQESASASTGSHSNYVGRRNNSLYVDTHLEDEMRQMQDELEGKKKRSLFARMKRASDHRNKSRNQN